jgi:hypothetical protein
MGYEWSMRKKSREWVAYFTVGEPPDLHATVWRIWAVPGKGDVYIGPRFCASDHKLSIHSSGVRHLRGDGPCIRSQEPSGDWIQEGKNEFRWKAPDRFGPGFELVWRIVTPASELSRAKLHRRFMSKVEWTRLGAAGTGVEFLALLSFGLLYNPGDWPLRREMGGECLLRWRLGNGTTFYFVRRHVPLTDAHARWFKEEQAASTRPADWAKDGSDKFDYRMHIIQDVREMHFRGCFDLACEYGGEDTSRG